MIALFVVILYANDMAGKWDATRRSVPPRRLPPPPSYRKPPEVTTSQCSNVLKAIIWKLALTRILLTLSDPRSRVDLNRPTGVLPGFSLGMFQEITEAECNNVLKTTTWKLALTRTPDPIRPTRKGSHLNPPTGGYLKGFSPGGTGGRYLGRAYL